MSRVLAAELGFSSCAGLTRASIMFATKMDGRIKSGHVEKRDFPA